MARKTKTPKLGTRARPAYQQFCWVPKDTRHVSGVIVKYARGADEETVPCITLRGHWLRKAGFPIGSRVLIQVGSQGNLSIDRI